MDNIKMCIEEIKLLLLTKTQKIGTEGKCLNGDVHQETLFLIFGGARDVTYFGVCHIVARISLNDGKMRMKHGFCWLIGVWKILMKFHVDVCREISQRSRLT